MYTTDKGRAIAVAKQATDKSGLESMVRNAGTIDAPKYFVCRRYEAGKEGYVADAGYQALGTLVWMKGMAE